MHRNGGMFGLFKKDWDYHVNMIERRKKSFLNWDYVSNHALWRLGRWKKAVRDAELFLNESYASNHDENQFKLRKAFLDKEIEILSIEREKYNEDVSYVNGYDWRGSGA
jgi:hypothetical protein